MKREIAAALVLFATSTPARADPTALYFSMRNCGPCKVLQATLFPILRENGVGVVEWDMDEANGTWVAEEQGVDAAPTVIGFVRREEVARFQGVPSVEEQRAFARRLRDLADGAGEE